MDMMAEINQYLSSPAFKQAREARRAARSQALYAQTALALGRPSAVMAREARGGWNMPADDRDIIEGAAIGSQHPGAAALMVVRQALAEYHVPNNVSLRYTGMKRVSGHGPCAVDEGIIFVEATLHSLSGPRHHVDIPVIVKEGRLLSPSVLVYNGHTRVLAQSTFDDIIGGGEFKADVADRNNMYAPPPDRNANAGPKRRVPVINPGMFALAPSRKHMRSAAEALTSWERDGAEVIAEEALAAIDRRQLRTVADLEAYLNREAQNDADAAREAGVETHPDHVERVQSAAMARMRDRLDPDELRAGRLHVICETCYGEGYVERSDPTREDPGYYNVPCPDCKGDSDDWGSYDAAKQAFYEPDVSELLENGSLGRDVPGAANSHLDMAERPLDDALMPGQTVTLKQNATVRDRGGVAYSIAKGTKGRVVRDVDGANWAYVVRFADLGYAATVPRRALA